MANSTHGLSGTRIHHEWTSMKRRCKPNTADAKTYYNRGISICDEWQYDFLAFYSWAMSHGYNDSLSLDRIDNNKGYSPNNCRWIPITKQQNNKSNTVHIFYNGKDYCLRNLCMEIGFPYKTAHRRYQRMKKKGLPINTDKLFSNIQKDKIPFRYRK